MAKLDLFEVEGFNELNRKLKLLPDRVKRSEVLKIQRQLAKPIQRAYAANLPVDEGALSRSVAIRSVSIRRSGGNPIINVLPGKRGKNDGYYRFMVIPKGSRPGSRRKGSRKGMNRVTPEARDKTLQQTETGVVSEGERKIGAYVQKQIDKLSI
jgi:hypothetical protein